MQRPQTLAIVLLTAFAVFATTSTTTATTSSTTATTVETQTQQYPPYTLFFPREEGGTGATIAINDEFYHSVGYRACFASASDTSCSDVDPEPAYRCGNTEVTMDDGSADGLLVELSPVLLDDDLSICGATTGTVSVFWWTPVTG